MREVVLAELAEELGKGGDAAEVVAGLEEAHGLGVELDEGFCLEVWVSGEPGPRGGRGRRELLTVT